MRVALIQMPVVPDKQRNIQTALAKIRGRRPTTVRTSPSCRRCSAAPMTTAASGPTGSRRAARPRRPCPALAAERELYHRGRLHPGACEDGKVYNTSYVYGPDGRQLARHRKAHLFDIDVPGGQRFRESDTLSPGNAITTFETAFGTMGLCICFDLRFEELARCMCLRGARVIFVPAAFNMTTGPAHWELLFRQRAVDNQCFTVGVSPARDEAGLLRGLRQLPGRGSLGHGAVPGRGGGRPRCTPDLDLDRLEAVRTQLPILSARRTDLYEVRER